MGVFLTRVSEQKYDEAIAELKFNKLSALFREQGVARNASDAACSQWVADLLQRPAIRELRGEAVTSSAFAQALSVAHGLYKASAPHFQDKRFDGVLEKLSAIVIFATVAVNGGSSKDATPSIVRRSIDLVKGLDSKCQLALAMKHGKVGKHIMRCSQVVVQQNQQDIVGNELLKKVVVRAFGSGRVLMWPMLMGVLFGCGALRQDSEGTNYRPARISSIPFRCWLQVAWAYWCRRRCNPAAPTSPCNRLLLCSLRSLVFGTASGLHGLRQRAYRVPMSARRCSKA